VSLLRGMFFLVDWELYQTRGMIFTYRIIFDWIRLRFLVVVFFISSCVMFYREEYMAREPLKNSFAFVVFLFVGSIMFLIVRPNLLRVLLG
jgi:NADH:ubiquinone oxidoreductase subunit 5 (subunit L)/multisubunit Na+/H+ antiporter MnhA subunit